MKEKSIIVIKISKDNVEVKRIENSLKSFQEQVEGYIEVFMIGKNDVICNEEGKLMGLEPNLYVTDNSGLREILCGNLLICNHDKNGEFSSLTNEEIEKYMNNKTFKLYREIDIRGL